MKSLLFFLVLSASTFAFAQESRCLPEASVTQVIQDFNLMSWSQDDDTWQRVRKIELCNGGDLLNNLVKAILYMQQSPKAAVNKELQSVVMQEGPFNFFKNRIKTIFFESDAGSVECRVGGVVAYVNQTETNSMHICSSEIKNYTSSLMMSYVLIHEARHIDGYRHTRCEHGVLAKFDTDPMTSGGCDPDYETQGSYGVGTAFLLDVYRSTDDPVMKQSARSNAVVDLVQRFNKMPLGLVEGAVTQSKGGDIAFFDGVNQYPLKMAPNFGVMASRFDAAVFFGHDGSTKTYLYSDNLGETEGGFAKQYRTEFSEDDQNNLVDLYFASADELYSCFLFERKIHCGKGNDPDVVIALSAIKPVSFIQNESSSIVSGKALYISAADGYIYKLPATYQELRSSSESDFIRSKNTLNVTSLVNVSGKGEYAVDLTGQLSSYQKSKRKWTVVPAYKGQLIKKVISPYMWSKQIEKL